LQSGNAKAFIQFSEALKSFISFELKALQAVFNFDLGSFLEQKPQMCL
jgi:hypothetical protein